jgi:hypothetical protein
MPPAAIGAAFVAMGATAATGAAVTALVAAAYTYAVVGAVVGAATSLISGGSIIKGALKGAMIGGIGGAIGSAAGLIGEAGATGAGVGEAGLAGSEVGGGVAPLAADEFALTGAVGAGAGGGAGAGAGAGAGGAGTGATGILGKAGEWIKTNPQSAALAAQGLGGAAKGISENMASQDTLNYLMERDRLNRDAIKIKGLTNIELKTVLPSIAKFTETPKWQMPQAGLIGGGT